MTELAKTQAAPASTSLAAFCRKLTAALRQAPWPAVLVTGMLLALALPLPWSVLDAVYLRRVGVLLQILGLVTVAAGLCDVYVTFRTSPLLQRGPVIVEAPHPAILELQSGTGLAAIAEPTTTEERLTALESTVKRNQQLAAAQIANLRDTNAALTRALQEERTARRHTEHNLRDLIKEVTAGGLYVESVGVVWLFLGIVLTGFPEEIACLNVVRLLASWTGASF